MPKYSYNKQGGSITWDSNDWLSGLHPQYSTGSLTSVRFLTNKMALQTSINPYRYLGALLPGALPVAATNNSQITTFLRNAVVKGSDAYLVSNGALVQKITGIASPLVIETTNWPHSINSNANSEAGQDIILYNAKVSSTSTQLMFVSYNNTSKGDVAMYNFSTASTVWDDDFMSTVPASAAALTKSLPHPMVVGDDDILYIGNGNILAGFDGQTGADGTFNPAILTLPAGYVITSYARIQNFLVIFAYYDNGSGTNYYLGNAKAFFWNYIDLDPTQVVDLTDNYVSAGFQYNSTIGCFTQGRNENSLGSQPSKLKIWNGSEFETKETFFENIPIHGGVEVLGQTINWNAQGVLYQWGTPFPNDTKTSFNRIAQGSGTTSGMLRTFTTTIQGLSSGATATGGLDEIDVVLTGFATGAAAVLPTAEPDFPYGYRGQIKTVRIQFAYSVSAGRNIVFRLVRSGTTNGAQITTLIADTDNFVSAGIDTLVKEFTTDQVAAAFPPFVALRPDLQWNAGTATDDALPVERIEVEYDLIIYQNV